MPQMPTCIVQGIIVYQRTRARHCKYLKRSADSPHQLYKMKLVLLFFTLVFMAPEVTALIQTEYRILLPYSLEQFRNGYLWSVAESSLYETGGGEGVEMVINKPYEDVVPMAQQLGVLTGQYTRRILHLASKVGLPRMIRSLAPSGSLEISEKSWEAFPYVFTEYSNGYMKEGFHVKITTKYVDDDDCQLDYVFPERNSPSVLIDKVDICKTTPQNKEWDPTQCSSEKLNITPLTSGWRERNPHMCVYSFVEVYCRWFGLQTKLENMIAKAYRTMVSRNYRQMFCWADQWAGLTLEEVRQREYLVKDLLDLIRPEGKVRGVVAKD